MKWFLSGLGTLAASIVFSCQVSEIERTGEPNPAEEKALDSRAESESDSASEQTLDTAVLESFESGLMLALEEGGCSCHTNTNPKFLNDDPEKSYETIAALIDLDSPADSDLYTKIEEKEHNCGSNCADVAETLLSGIEDMAASSE